MARPCRQSQPSIDLIFRLLALCVPAVRSCVSALSAVIADLIRNPWHLDPWLHGLPRCARNDNLEGRNDNSQAGDDNLLGCDDSGAAVAIFMGDRNPLACLGQFFFVRTLARGR